jgi:hypothetical protein
MFYMRSVHTVEARETHRSEEGFWFLESIIYINIYIYPTGKNDAMLSVRQKARNTTSNSAPSNGSNTNGGWRCLPHLSRTHDHKCGIWAFRQHGSGPSRVPHIAVVSSIVSHQSRLHTPRA